MCFGAFLFCPLPSDVCNKCFVVAALSIERSIVVSMVTSPLVYTFFFSKQKKEEKTILNN